MSFVVLDAGLKFDDFSGWDLAPRQVEAKLVGSRARVTSNPGSLKPILEILRPRLGVLRLRREYMGYMIHWKWDYRGRRAAWSEGLLLTRRGRWINLIWNPLTGNRESEKTRCLNFLPETNAQFLNAWCLMFVAWCLMYVCCSTDNGLSQAFSASDLKPKTFAMLARQVISARTKRDMEKLLGCIDRLFNNFVNWLVDRQINSLIHGSSHLLTD